MGMIIAPYFLGGLAIFIYSVYTIYGQIIENTFNSIHLIYGLLLTLLIYGGVVFSYKLEEKAWALSPVFRFPFYMIYIPFLIFLLSKINFGIDISVVSHSMLMSIISAGILMTIFNGYVFGILDKLGKNRHY